MKFTTRHLSLVILFALLFAFNLIFSGCFCTSPAVSDKTPSDEISVTDLSETDLVSDSDDVFDSDDVSFSDIISDTDILSESDMDISDSTVTSESDGVLTTDSTQNNSRSRDKRNAPGIYGATYEHKYYIVVYLKSQSVCVYGKDSEGFYNKLIKSFTCSTGKAGSSTPTGLYSIIQKLRWAYLKGSVAGQYSCCFRDKYWLHSVPYNKKSPNTLNDAAYDKLGKRASSGCIRLCTRDAKWIYDNCAVGTQVFVYNGSGPAGSGVPARVDLPEYAGWDPSDRWSPGNPYFTNPPTSTSTTSSTVASEDSTSSSTSVSDATSASSSSETPSTSPSSSSETTATTATTATTTSTTTTTTTTTTTAATTTTTAAASGDNNA